jgi:trigger factor
MYYSDIKESIISSLAPKAISNELKKQKLEPVASPVINKIDYEEGAALKLTAQFDVWAEFELPEYKKIRVSKKKKPVSAKDINASLDNLRERSTQYTPVEDRGVKEEDYVAAEIKGKEVKTKKMLPTEKVYIMAGHPENEKALNDCILGLQVNGEKDFNVHYENDHQNKKLAGKEISYHIKILSIKEKKLPEADDSFAKEIGKFESIKDLKAEIKKELTHSFDNHYKRELSEEIVRKVADKVKIELPESIVRQETLVTLQRSLTAPGVSQASKNDLEALKKDAQEKAEKNIKNHLILAKIAEKENLTITEDEINEELKAIAKDNNVPLPRVMENINKNSKKEDLRQNMLLKKTVDFLVEQAIIE